MRRRQTFFHGFIIHNEASSASYYFVLVLVAKPNNFLAILVAGQTAFVGALRLLDVFLNLFREVYVIHKNLILNMLLML